MFIRIAWKLKSKVADTIQIIKKNQKKFFVHAAGMDGYMKNNAEKVNKIKG